MRQITDRLHEFFNGFLAELIDKHSKHDWQREVYQHLEQADHHGVAQHGQEIRIPEQRSELLEPYPLAHARKISQTKLLERHGNPIHGEIGEDKYKDHRRDDQKL